MIPESKKTVLANALQSTFGVSEFDDISQLTTGLSSALVFRMNVKGKSYLLKLNTRTDAMGDPSHQFICMKPSAEVELGPRIRYMNAEERIWITDFIEAKPFPIRDARVKTPALLKRLHSLPPFPARFNFIEFVDGLIRKFQDEKILPESMTSEVFRQYAKIPPLFPRECQDLVSSHNDLKPENILFDGRQPWLVDWEAAFLNDRYIDLAIVANFLVRNDGEEREYLKNYFGEEVNEYQRARFFLMRQVLHMSYFIFFMRLVSAAGKPLDMDLIKTDFTVFNESMWYGQIDLKNIDNKQIYAWVHLQRLQHNLQMKKFDEALQTVSGYVLT